MAEGHSIEDIRKHVRVYMMVFGALAVLTVVTVGVSYLDLPFAPALTLALVIASVKAGLVALYFMHLVSERKVIFWMLALTFAFLLALILLFIAAKNGHGGSVLVP